MDVRLFDNGSTALFTSLTCQFNFKDQTLHLRHEGAPYLSRIRQQDFPEWSHILLLFLHEVCQFRKVLSKSLLWNHPFSKTTDSISVFFIFEDLWRVSVSSFPLCISRVQGKVCFFEAYCSELQQDLLTNLTLNLFWFWLECKLLTIDWLRVHLLTLVNTSFVTLSSLYIIFLEELKIKKLRSRGKFTGAQNS